MTVSVTTLAEEDEAVTPALEDEAATLALEEAMAPAARAVRAAIEKRIVNMGSLECGEIRGMFVERIRHDSVEKND